MDAITGELPLGTKTTTPSQHEVVHLVAVDGRNRPEEDFHWGPGNPDLLAPSQPAIAVYQNVWGQVVIREEADWNDEGDPFIRIGLHHVQALIDRLQAIMRRQ